MCMYLHVSWMYHAGMSRKVMLCTLTFAMTVSLGCIHDYVHSDDVHSAHHCQGQIGTKSMYLPSPEPLVYVPCSTSTCGPWSGPMTTLPLPLEKWMGIKPNLCHSECASDGLPESFLRLPANFTCTYSSHTENTHR